MSKISELSNLAILNDNVIVPVVDLSEANPAQQNKRIPVQNLIGPKGDKGDAGDSGIDGADGKSAYEIAVDGGFVGTEADFIASLKGDKGDTGDAGIDGVDGKSAYQLALDSGFVGTETEYLDSLKGEKGDQGDAGVDGQSAFQLWQAIPGNESKTQQEWFDSLKGEKGDKGDQGDQGERGTLWVVLDRDPQPIDGRPGDYYLNSLTLAYFVKTSDTLWGPLGYLGGGNVYDASADGIPKVRLDGAWVDLDVLEAPVDNGYYIRKDGAWVKLDRYDLKVASTMDVLDLSAQQVFTIDASVDRTLSFTNVPSADRAMTVVIKIAGTGTITWPAGILWNAETAPTLGATFTVVVLFWTGVEWIGTTGPSA